MSAAGFRAAGRCAMALAALLATALLVGCAAPARGPGDVARGQAGVWSGRLSLQVESDPPQVFSAGFELQGAPQEGSLTLTSPLGGVLAVMHWSPDGARLRQGDGIRMFATVDAMTEQITGAPVPVQSLFAWLQGSSDAVAGWHTDLSALDQGRLQAVRQMPLPVARLRLVLNRD